MRSTPRVHSPYLRHLERGALRSVFSSQKKALFAVTPPNTRLPPLCGRASQRRELFFCLFASPVQIARGKSPPPHTHAPRSPPPCLSLLCSASQIPSEGLSAGGRGRQAPSFPGFFALEMLETLRATLLRGLKGALGAAGTPRFPQAGLRGRQLRVLSAPASRPQRPPTVPNGP